LSRHTERGCRSSTPSNVRNSTKKGGTVTNKSVHCSLGEVVSEKYTGRARTKKKKKKRGCWPLQQPTKTTPTFHYDPLKKRKKTSGARRVLTGGKTSKGEGKTLGKGVFDLENKKKKIKTTMTAYSRTGALPCREGKRKSRGIQGAGGRRRGEDKDLWLCFSGCFSQRKDKLCIVNRYQSEKKKSWDIGPGSLKNPKPVTRAIRGTETMGLSGPQTHPVQSDTLGRKKCGAPPPDRGRG